MLQQGELPFIMQSLMGMNYLQSKFQCLEEQAHEQWGLIQSLLLASRTLSPLKLPQERSQWPLRDIQGQFITTMMFWILTLPQLPLTFRL